MWHKLKTTVIPHTNGYVYPSMSDSDTTVLSTSILMNPIYGKTTLNDVQSDIEVNKQQLPRTILSQISTVDNHSTGTIAFYNVNYVVKTTNEYKTSHSKYSLGLCTKSAKAKQILFNVSGKFSKGLHAILGPTGCGKSSLLDVLAHRKDPRHVFGDIFIDGFLHHSSFKHTVGYVVQEDVLCNTLTVRENLSFSANLRLSKKLSAHEKHERVWSVICELGLKHCADIHIGTEFLRGISGGEKKRTCIGMELVLFPRILLVDEPTTGLDAATASYVMDGLKQLSQQGRTVIFSIHQPRYSIFKLFDTVTFMCQGRCVFHGPTNDVIPYFATQGYQCEMHDNPADFVLDILIDAIRIPELLTKLDNAYADSLMYKESLQFTVNRQTQTNHQEPEHTRRPSLLDVLNSIRKEIWYVSKRTILNALRRPTMTLSQLSCATIYGLVVGLVYYQLETTVEPGIQNRRGALFFMIVTQIFTGLSALEPFLKERALFIHEYVTGYYRISSFFFAKLIYDLSIRITSSTIFSFLAYFMTGLTFTIHQFLIFMLTMFMIILFGSALSLFISATVPVLATAVTVTAIIMTIMMVFSGYLVSLATVPKWLSWMRWLSAIYYASNVVTINEFKGLKFCLANMTSICPITGEDVLNYQNIDHANAWDLWKYFVALTIMTLVCFILAYIQLIRIKKTK